MLNNRVRLAAVTMMVLTVAACTVRPLYSTADGNLPGQGDVIIESVDTRVEQQIRNRLIFMLNGGKSQPETAAFYATLNASSSTSSILSVSDPTGDSDTTASRVVLNATLTIKSDDGTVLKTYRRTKNASFDRSTQEFANSRAEIDAQNRAAVELAEEFRILIFSWNRK